MNRSEQLDDLMRQAGLSVPRLAALIDVPESEVDGWLAGGERIPDSLFSFLHTYLELKSISRDVSCPLYR
ncbi:hypothetical protein [Endothiovibrio diazotrophicus]